MVELVLERGAPLERSAREHIELGECVFECDAQSAVFFHPSNGHGNFVLAQNPEPITGAAGTADIVMVFREHDLFIKSANGLMRGARREYAKPSGVRQKIFRGKRVRVVCPVHRAIHERSLMRLQSAGGNGKSPQDNYWRASAIGHGPEDQR